MTIELTNRFIKDFKKLSPQLKKKTTRTLEKLSTSILEKKQAGMQVKKMRNQPNIYEARVDIHCRVTFNKYGNSLIMRRVGGHDIYKNP